MKLFKALNIFRFIRLIINARIEYNNAKKDPELKKTTTDFGKKAIWYAIVFALLSIGGLALLIYAFSIITSAVFFAVLLIIISAYFIIYGIPYIFLSLNLVIKQLCLNRKFISWLALIIFLLVAGVATCAILYILGKLNVI